jgi:hypothetical protein
MAIHVTLKNSHVVVSHCNNQIKTRGNGKRGIPEVAEQVRENLVREGFGLKG